MNESFLILFAIGIAFLISFFTFFNFQNIIQSDEMFRKSEFFQNSFPNEEKKIFLVGASHIGQLNTTYIQSILEDKGHNNFKVYNLAIAGDKPEKRVKQLDYLIDLEPKLIVYGLGYRDFQHWPSNKPTLLPDVEEIIHEKSDQLLLNYEINSNPKFTTLSSIKILFNELKGNERVILPKNAPFFEEDSNLLAIKTNEELKEVIKKNLLQPYEINQFSKNLNAIALKEILNQLDSKKIKVILILTPHHKYFLESVNQQNEEIFTEIINQSISEDIKIFDLRDKYINLEIWGDLTHVAFNKESLIFSEDVGEIILEILEQKFLN